MLEPAREGDPRVRRNLPHFRRLIGYLKTSELVHRLQAMTLILSRISNRYVVQVSDRLVTRAMLKVDPSANKMLFVVTHGGMAAISYTGLAVIESIPTDQWIAQILTGNIYPPGITPSAFSSGPKSLPSFHQIAERLQRELSAVFAAHRQAASRSTFFDIMISGWQWGRRSRPRPTNINVNRKQGSEVFLIDRSSRHLGRGHAVFLTPDANKSLIDVAELRRRFEASRSVVDIEKAAVWTICNASENSKVVGPDCMSVAIQHPDFGGTTISYYGSPTELNLVDSSDGSSKTLSNAIYTPWVIGFDQVISPMATTIGLNLSIRGYPVAITGGSDKVFYSSTPGVLFAATGQRRPKL